MGAIALDLGVGERQLERLFVDGTGLTLRMYRRILRARRAIMAAGRGLPLVDVAAECGFADQAHLAREVRDWQILSFHNMAPLPSPQEAKP